MLTANYARYWEFEMKREYVENSGRQSPYAPPDNGSIDAPECLAAGSHEAYTTKDGWQCVMPTAISRGK